MTTTAWPAARWLDGLAGPDADLRRAIVARAMADIGIEEQRANRSGYIDELLRNANTLVGQPWCAAAVRQWWWDGGAMVPTSGSAAVRTWVPWAQQMGLWVPLGSAPAIPGDAVIYRSDPTKPPNHMGVVVRAHARGLRAVEGNTSYAGFSREGIAVDYKPVTMKHVMGFIRPRPRGGPALG